MVIEARSHDSRAISCQIRCLAAAA
jgi:hypothetical protein